MTPSAEKDRRCGCGASLCEDWRRAVIDPTGLADVACGCGSTVCRFWREHNVLPPVEGDRS